jgi:hypothetical protein
MIRMKVLEPRMRGRRKRQILKLMGRITTTKAVTIKCKGGIDAVEILILLIFYI